MSYAIMDFSESGEFGLHKIWGGLFSANTASVLLAIGPFIALIAAHFVTHDEKITLFKLIGVAMCFTGIFILFGDGFMDGDIDRI